MRDFQRSKVDNWEIEVVYPLDKSLVEYKHIQSVVDYVWEKEGYKYPPKVLPLAKQNKKSWATGSRRKLHFRENEKCPTWVILHEMSHAITCDLEGVSDKHGENFVGIYINLVSKYLNISFVMLTYTAEKAGLAYNLSAKAVFLD